MVLPRGLSLFLFSSPQIVRQGQQQNGTWSLCIHQLAERQQASRRTYSSLAKRQLSFPYLSTSKRPRGSAKRSIPVTITHERIVELSRELLHNFREPGTLATAMVHKSLLSDVSDHEVFAELRPGIVQRMTKDNEKLELLGDKVIGLLVCDHLLKTHPSFNEGQLSQVIHATVSNKDLARYCRALRLDSYLITAHNVQLLRWSSQPGSFFEALLGALYTDGGLPAASRFFSERVAHLIKMKLLSGINGDPKRLLQEHLVASGLPGNDLNRLLKYVPVSKCQGGGSQSFTQAIHLLGRRFSIGTGPSRTEADQIAATRFLASLKKRKSTTACVLIRLARKVSEKDVLAKAMKVREQSKSASDT